MRLRPLRGLATLSRCVPKARGLALGYTLSPAARACDAVALRTQGSRTRTGLHAVARCASLRRCRVAYPGLADSHWATLCRPLRGLATLSRLRTQGSRTRPGLHAVARCAGLRRCRVAYPGLADSP